MKLIKPYTAEAYAAFAGRCNAQGLDIVDKTTCLEATPQIADLAELQAIVRHRRNHYLQTTDCRMLSDYPQTLAEQEAYRTYRQYLRDYTASPDWWEKNPLDFASWQEVSDVLK
ncbi:MAG: hypothetical protein IJ529_00185 [Alphaproteobacteria bacterium]|nr:hypothetical protein [Alphaproteobacteria bacterium]MBQ9235125.1 hypothetical protein [Alphaproteobacteria bacterium]